MTARRWFAATIVTALAGTAHAGLVMAPAGWVSGVQHTNAAEVYVPPGNAPGVELVVSHVATPVGLDARPAAARAAIDDLHAMSHRAALSGSNVSEDAWQEHADPATKLADATLSFRDGGAQLAETARIVIAGDATQMVAVTGECITREDAPPALVSACKAALATLDPGIDPKDRVPVTLAPAGTPAPDQAPVPAPTPTAPAAPSRPQPTMSEGSHVPLPPISIPQETREADRRPVFVGAGIVLLAALFWWNMRRRARLERENEDSE